jgi:hypothetical protein
MSTLTINGKENKIWEKTACPKKCGKMCLIKFCGDCDSECPIEQANNVVVYEANYISGSYSCWAPAVALRYNYSHVFGLGIFNSVSEAVKFAKEASIQLNKKISVSLKYLNRPETKGIEFFK